jgi:hypothetical protein
MPKTSRKSAGRARKTAKRKRPARAAAPRRSMSAVRDTESHVDGCDIDFSEGDVTPDSELPQATGGVEVVRRRRVR